MAQEEGFEPPTSRLTAGCSTTELLLNGFCLKGAICFVGFLKKILMYFIVRSGFFKKTSLQQLETFQPFNTPC